MPKQAPLRPYDRRVDRPRQNPNGSYSTEITRTVETPNGWANVPSLYWNQKGSQDFGQFNDDQLAQLAAQYESQSGSRFPRYGSLNEAEAAAEQRSAGGGALQGQLNSMADIPKVKRNIKRMIDGGASESEIDQYLGSQGVTTDQLRSAPQASGPTAQPMGMGEDVLKSLGSGLTRGVTGVMGMEGDINQLAGKGIDWAKGKMGLDTSEPTKFRLPITPMAGLRIAADTAGLGGYLPEAPTSQSLTNSFEKNITPLHDPQTKAGGYAETIGEFAPGVLIPGGGGFARRAVQQVLAPAVASEAAGQFTEGTPMEPYARTVGAVLGGNVGGIKGAFRTKMRMPSIDDLYASKNSAYQTVDQIGATYSPGAYDMMIAGMASAMKKDHLNPMRHPKAASMLQDMETAKASFATPGAPTLTELDQLRQVIRRDVVQAGDDAEEHFGDRMMDYIDRFVDSAQPMVKGPGGQMVADRSGRAAAAMRDARRANTVLRKSELIDDAITRAVRRANSTGSGGNVDNAIRQNIRALLDKPERIRSFSDAEKKLMEQIVNPNTRGQDFLRLVGKLSPNSSGLMAALIGGATAANPALGVGVGAAGFFAKRAADNMTRGKADQLQGMIRGGAQPTAARRPLTAAERSALALALSSGNLLDKQQRSPLYP